jgi:hypothetical protein
MIGVIAAEDDMDDGLAAAELLEFVSILEF